MSRNTYRRFLFSLRQKYKEKGKEKMENELKEFLDKQEEKTETAEKPEYKEITLKFGKNFVGDEFQGKDGNTYRQIMIPPERGNKAAVAELCSKS